MYRQKMFFDLHDDVGALSIVFKIFVIKSLRCNEWYDDNGYDA